MRALQYFFVIGTLLFAGCQVQDNTIQPGDTLLLQLPDHRPLSYVEYGPADGRPVLYFHGFPGSHQDVHLFNGPELAEKYHLRLIAVDRPGYGNSGSLPDRSLADWSDDIQYVINSLGLDSFSIFAYSGGGPFALACAHARLKGLDKVIIVSGMGPYTAPESKEGSAMLIPKAPKLILKGMSKMVAEKPEKLEANLRKGFPEVDLAILEQAEQSEAMNQTLKEAFSSGYLGGLEDSRIYKKEWGFELSDIGTQIFLWHGDMDENVKIETASFLAGQLPNCQMEVRSNEGHLSLIYKYADEIFRSFVSASPSKGKGLSQKKTAS